MTIPYFYIIEHILSGKRYAGSRWQNKCNPDELLRVGGYSTSSNKVHKLGIENFKILKIVTEFGGLTAYNYETSFLVDNNCAASEVWLNTHNNTRPPPWGSDEYKKLLFAKYGVEHNTGIPEVKRKMKQQLNETLKNHPEIAKNRMTADVKLKISKKSKGRIVSDETRLLLSKNHIHGTFTVEGRNKRSASITNVNKTNNAMNNPESRKKVGLSKLGKRKVWFLDGTYKYLLPGGN